MGTGERTGLGLSKAAVATATGSGSGPITVRLELGRGRPEEPLYVYLVTRPLEDHQSTGTIQLHAML
jgi:hypothetical protein